MTGILKAEPIGKFVVGVDTHKYVHTAVAVDVVGGVQGTTGVTADRGGYEQLDAWARRFGQVLAFGVEGTGSYGAGPASHLRRQGHKPVEVNRPDRRVRRRRGRSDPIDAENAARAVPAGTATATPESGEGTVGMIRHLEIARDGAVKARTQAMVALKALIVTVPDELRRQLQGLPKMALIDRCAGLRPGPVTSPAASAKHSIRAMARRWKGLHDEVREHDALPGELTRAHAPDPVDAFGIGADTTAEVPVTVGDNPERIRSQAAFAKLAGVCPVPASSGRTNRHRLNCGGHRQLNSALYRVVIVRMRFHQPTIDHVIRRTAEGKTKQEIIRCLKRYLAREIYQYIKAKQPPTTAT
ncbi:IS110 family transposase (plasmid) [Embleya sp. NBC_00888]|uniref:IS110 family transposase n=1 Tax=Embleya sp. NBC_00888 TaxID=2975960 RepID=UPI002F90C0F4|nr:IS110 family transposase [Embleya sp. NBC_00888]